MVASKSRNCRTDRAGVLAYRRKGSTRIGYNGIEVIRTESCIQAYGERRVGPDFADKYLKKYIKYIGLVS